MASKRERRAQKKREKQKKKRAAARSARKGPGRRALDWPIAESWISANWHEQGATVHGVLTRAHPSGRTAAAVFEVDLCERGVVSAVRYANAHPGEIQAELVRRSTNGPQMHVCEPELVAKLVQEGRRLGEANGVPQPAAIADCLALFPDVDPADSPHVFLTGDPEADAPTDEVEAPGPWARLKRRLGFGGSR